ncbi:MAG TPA: hypothetical protein VJM76_03325 [Gammaproteobacteria bacterium]|nr:hypothetical protein [Gammaproteobacteria bacterium]
MLTILAYTLAAFAANVGHVCTILTYRFATPATDISHMLSILAHCLTAFAAYFGHMLAVMTYRFATLPAGNLLVCRFSFHAVLLHDHFYYAHA